MILHLAQRPAPLRGTDFFWFQNQGCTLA